MRKLLKHGGIALISILVGFPMGFVLGILTTPCWGWFEASTGIESRVIADLQTGYTWCLAARPVSSSFPFSSASFDAIWQAASQPARRFRPLGTCLRP